MIFHVILNMQEYGVDLNYDEMIFITSVQYGFARMCEVPEAVKALVHFFIHVVMYIPLYI